MVKQLIVLCMLLSLIACNNQTTNITPTPTPNSQAVSPADSVEPPPAPVTTTQQISTTNIVPEQPEPTTRLHQILDRGKLICGGNANLPGFGYKNKQGLFSGFDIDFCKAIAVAIFGQATPNTLEIRPLTAVDRAIAIRSKEIDVVIRNTTHTLSRELQWRAEFGPVIFFDGQGLLTPGNNNVKSLEDLEGRTICSNSGSTSKKSLKTVMDDKFIQYEHQTYVSIEEMIEAYKIGECEAITSDKSALISIKSQLDKPDFHIILEEQLSEEPLAPLYPQGDVQWGQIVNWTIYCTILAEHHQISLRTVDNLIASSDKSEVQQLLGVEGDLGHRLGLQPDFCANIIRTVGNYGEIYNRNLGEGSDFELARGVNDLWSAGGLIYAPPFR